MKSSFEESTFEQQKRFEKRWRWLTTIRPAILSAFLIKVLTPNDRRKVVQTPVGCGFTSTHFHTWGNRFCELEATRPIPRRCYVIF